jgi:hypothetical protein
MSWLEPAYWLVKANDGRYLHHKKSSQAVWVDRNLATRFDDRNMASGLALQVDGKVVRLRVKR